MSIKNSRDTIGNFFKEALLVYLWSVYNCMLSVRKLVDGCSVVSESSGEPIIVPVVVVAILEYEGYQDLYFGGAWCVWPGLSSLAMLSNSSLCAVGAVVRSALSSAPVA
jgi:hypothetical protein